MDSANTQVMSIRLSSEELQKIDAEAAEAGMSRADYIRRTLLSTRATPPADAGNSHIEALLRHLIYITNRIHIAVYSIAETAGTLSTERLETIYENSVTEGLQYMADLPHFIAKVQAQIAAHTNTAPSAAE